MNTTCTEATERYTVQGKNSLGPLKWNNTVTTHLFTLMDGSSSNVSLETLASEKRRKEIRGAGERHIRPAKGTYTTTTGSFMLTDGSFG